MSRHWAGRQGTVADLAGIRDVAEVVSGEGAEVLKDYAQVCMSESEGETADSADGRAKEIFASVPTAKTEKPSLEQVPKSVERFLAQVELPLYRYVLRHIGHNSEAVDLVQDAMLRWVEAGYHKKPPEQWRGLIYRIQLNRIRDWARARRRSRLLGFFSLASDAGEVGGGALEDRLAAPDGDGPGARYKADCLGEALAAALRTLPARQREVFNLRVLEGLDTRAAATAMGVGPGSVMTHLHRAMHALQAALADYESGD